MPVQGFGEIGERGTVVRRRAASSRQHRQPGRFHAAAHVAQQRERRRWRPLQIVEHEDNRLPAAGGAQPGTHRLEQSVGVQRRIEAGGGDRAAAGQFGHQPNQFFGQLAQTARQRIDGRGSAEPVQGGPERLVGHGEVLRTTTEQHHCTARVRAPGQVRRQPGLADPGLAQHPHDSRATASGEESLDDRHVVDPTDEWARIGGQLRWKGHVERRGSRRDPQGGVLAHDGQFQLAQFRRRVGAQLLAQRVPQLAIGGQRVGLPAQAVQREDAAGPGALAQRMPRHEVLGDAQRFPRAFPGEFGFG